jgi:beta-lactamase superfamily II metal-dependent hydrolase
VIDDTAPTPDELEVSVFGRGFGEAICIHVAGDWFLIDSCLNPETEAPAALSYLQRISVRPDAVRVLVVTHWDDDHTQGVTTLVRECDQAAVACSLALNRKDIVQFVLEQARYAGATGSGLDELRSVLTQCRSTGRLIWAKATLPLYPRESGSTPSVAALSPSDDAVSRSIESLIERAAEGSISYGRRYRAPEGPNGASVAATVRVEADFILLGADLEKSNNPLTGWEAVLTYARPSGRASLVKVPHHGSEGAHHDGMWEQMVETDAVAIVTPWVLAGGHLPTEDDLQRLRGVARRVYLTAMPTLGKVRKDSAVEKLITKVARVRVEELRGWGHVRARRRPPASEWTVEIGGDACEID